MNVIGHHTEAIYAHRSKANRDSAPMLTHEFPNGGQLDLRTDDS
jgi:hypothetical protein